jgi:cell fate (sporulation/competence/biofilm development) regulator YlbF (YheA/YmcA/DUF963 family)
MRNLIIMVLLLLGATADVQAQRSTMTFTRSEMTLNNVFKEIEQQTGHRISFSYKDIDPSQWV